MGQYVHHFDQKISRFPLISSYLQLGLGEEQARERARLRRAVRQVQVPLPEEPHHRRLAAEPEGQGPPEGNRIMTRCCQL